MMTMCSTLLAIGLTPFLTKLYASAVFEVEAGPMVVSMVMIVLLPILVGLILNSMLGEKLKRVKEVSPFVSVLVIIGRRCCRRFLWCICLALVWGIFGGGFLS